MGTSRACVQAGSALYISRDKNEHSHLRLWIEPHAASQRQLHSSGKAVSGWQCFDLRENKRTENEILHSSHSSENWENIAKTLKVNNNKRKMDFAEWCQEHVFKFIT